MPVLIVPLIAIRQLSIDIVLKAGGNRDAIGQLLFQAILGCLVVEQHFGVAAGEGGCGCRAARNHTFGHAIGRD